MWELTFLQDDLKKTLGEINLVVDFQVMIGLTVGVVAYGMERAIREITHVRLVWMQGLMLSGFISHNVLIKRF